MQGAIPLGLHQVLKGTLEAADIPGVNVYDVNHVSGDIHEVEADFYQREEDDWVFYARDVEVHRVSWFDVLSVSKSTLRPQPVERPSEELWL